MRPASTSVTLRRDLQGVAEEYNEKNAATLFAWPHLAPVFVTPEQAATYIVAMRENYIKPEEDSRASDGSYNRIGGEFGSANYNTEEHGLEYPLDDRRGKMYHRWIDFEQHAVRILTYKLLLNQEIRTRDLFQNAAFTSNGAATAWSDSSNAVPLTDLGARIQTLENNTGVPRSEFTLAIPSADKTEFLATAQVVDKSKYTYGGVQPSELTNLQIAAMLEIGRVITLRSVYDSKEEGVTPSMTSAWSSGAMYLGIFAQPGDPVDAMSAARTFVWDEESGNATDSLNPFIAERYRDESVRAEILRERWETDEVLTAELDLMCLKQSSDT